MLEKIQLGLLEHYRWEYSVDVQAPILAGDSVKNLFSLRSADALTFGMGSDI